MPDILHLGAAQVLQSLRAGEFSAEQYVAAVLRRLSACAQLNLTTWTFEQRILAQARAVDLARGRDDRRAPLAGLPILVKDNIDTAGVPTSAGTPALCNNYPRHHAPVVQRLLDQGALLLAKTNMHELASGATSSNPHFGPVRNPWAADRIAGGSSGGSAAALAALVGTVSLGTDTAGSVRIPASFCGVVGMRPSSVGPLLPYAASSGVVPLARDLDTIGPMGRTVADVIVLHEAVSGRAVVRARGISGARFGIPRTEHWTNLDPEVEAVCSNALAQLRRAGASFVDVDLSAVYAEATALFWILLAHGNRVDLEDYLKRHVPGLGMDQLITQLRSADVRYFLEQAVRKRLAPSEVENARHGRRTALRARYEALFAQHTLDGILFPTEPVLAPGIRPEGDRFDDTIMIGEYSFPSGLALIRNTFATCVLGAPGITIPAGLSAAGLPVGIEIDGVPGSDAALLDMAREIETVLGALAGGGDIVPGATQRRCGYVSSHALLHGL
jgi:indoleacetamide hydrolase